MYDLYLVILVFAIFVVVTVVVVFILKKRKKVFQNIQTIDMEEFIFTKEITQIKREFGEGAIFEFIKNKNFPTELRLKAFLVVSQIKTPEMIKLLKIGLSDEVDEIRLLCFSVLDGLEKILNEKLSFFLEQSNKKDDIKNNKQIAKLYWEFVYLGLADDEFVDVLLKQIMVKIKEVLKYKQDEEMLLMYAKILFYQKKLDESLHIFLKIGENSKTIPFLMEIYFYKKEYNKIQELAIKYPEIKFLEKFYFVYRFWHGNE